MLYTEIPTGRSYAVRRPEKSGNVFIRLGQAFAHGHRPGNMERRIQHGREEYYREMDQGFDVLRYCDNHWKPHTIATSGCSQWYHDHDKKCIRQ